MGVIVTPRQVGGSLIVAIPKEEVKKYNFQAGKPMEADFRPIPKSMFGAARNNPIEMTEEDRWDVRE